MSDLLNTVLPHAHGGPAARGLLRASPEDFEVEEQLGFELSGDGEHVCLWLEKQGANTQYVARQLAQYAGIKTRDVGFCGLKDRHAVTRQWFSLGLAGKAEPDWDALVSNEFRIIESRRHQRKLRRGVHSGNRFSLCLRELEIMAGSDRADLEQRLQFVAKAGVPNYFGEQRFGRDNLQLALAWARGEAGRPDREQRGIYLSVLRAHLYNQSLAERVLEGDWNELRDGDICLLSGSRSFFAAAEIDAELRQRNNTGDISAGLPLWGRGELECGAGRAREFERQRAQHQDIYEFLKQQGLELDWRATRLLPDDFSWQFCDDDCLKVEFGLAPGGYATAVLRELLDYTDLKRGTTVSEQP